MPFINSRYVDHFLALAHTELDRQMREQLQLGGTKDGGIYCSQYYIRMFLFSSTEARKRQFNDLLAQLLQIRNELTELESRERQAKAAKATPPNPAEEKTAKGWQEKRLCIEVIYLFPHQPKPKRRQRRKRSSSRRQSR
jgi:hypothetical protein